MKRKIIKERQHVHPQPEQFVVEGKTSHHFRILIRGGNWRQNWSLKRGSHLTSLVVPKQKRENAKEEQQGTSKYLCHRNSLWVNAQLRSGLDPFSFSMTHYEPLNAEWTEEDYEFSMLWSPSPSHQSNEFLLSTSRCNTPPTGDESNSSSNSPSGSSDEETKKPVARDFGASRLDQTMSRHAAENNMFSPSVITEETRAVCFGWSSHPGTVKWRSIVKEFVDDGNKRPEEFVEMVTQRLQQEHIHQILLCVNKDNVPLKYREFDVNHQPLFTWRIATFEEFQSRTRQRFNDGRKSNKNHAETLCRSEAGNKKSKRRSRDAWYPITKKTVCFDWKDHPGFTEWLTVLAAFADVYPEWKDDITDHVKNKLAGEDFTTFLVFRDSKDEPCKSIDGGLWVLATEKEIAERSKQEFCRIRGLYKDPPESGKEPPHDGGGGSSRPPSEDRPIRHLFHPNGPPGGASPSKPSLSGNSPSGSFGMQRSSCKTNDQSDDTTCESRADEQSDGVHDNQDAVDWEEFSSEYNEESDNGDESVSSHERKCHCSFSVCRDGDASSRNGSDSSFSDNDSDRECVTVGQHKEVHESNHSAATSPMAAEYPNLVGMISVEGSKMLLRDESLVSKLAVEVARVHISTGLEIGLLVGQKSRCPSPETHDLGQELSSPYKSMDDMESRAETIDSMFAHSRHLDIDANVVGDCYSNMVASNGDCEKLEAGKGTQMLQNKPAADTNLTQIDDGDLLLTAVAAHAEINKPSSALFPRASSSSSLESFSVEVDNRFGTDCIKTGSATFSPDSSCSSLHLEWPHVSASQSPIRSITRQASFHSLSLDVEHAMHEFEQSAGAMRRNSI